jgi:hypothetical protein
MKNITKLITLATIPLLFSNCNPEKNTNEDYNFKNYKNYKSENSFYDTSDSINPFNPFFGDSIWNSLNSKEERIDYIKKLMEENKK